MRFFVVVGGADVAVRRGELAQEGPQVGGGDQGWREAAELGLLFGRGGGGAGGRGEGAGARHPAAQEAGVGELTAASACRKSRRCDESNGSLFETERVRLIIIVPMA